MMKRKTKGQPMLSEPRPTIERVSIETALADLKRQHYLAQRRVREWCLWAEKTTDSNYRNQMSRV